MRALADPEGPEGLTVLVEVTLVWWLFPASGVWIALLVGALVGALIGLVGGRPLGWARARAWRRRTSPGSPSWRWRSSSTWRHSRGAGTGGAVAGPIVLDLLTPTMVLYAVLSLTVVRMVPVALARLGARLDRRTVLFIGWFGPRGPASLVFALLALEELGPEVDRAVALIGITVLLSVVAHGLTAAPLALRHGRSGPRDPSSPDDPTPRDTP